MTSCRILAGALCAVVFAGSSGALASGSAAVGLIGERFVEGFGGITHQRYVSANGSLGGLSLNLPVVAHLDLVAGGSWYEIKNTQLSGLLKERLRASSGWLGLTGYARVAEAALFLRGTSEWQRTETRYWYSHVGFFDMNEHQEFWQLAAGGEFCLGPIALTPSIGYQDRWSYQDWESHRQGLWIYDAEAHVWLNRHWGVFVDVNEARPRAGGTELWTYAGGVRWRF